MVNMRSAATITPKVLVAQFIPVTAAALYQPTTDGGAQLLSVKVVNNDTVSRTVTLQMVKSGNTPGPAILSNVTMTAGQSIELGETYLGGGDSIWAVAATVSTIALFITGIEFSNSVGTVIPGVQTDAVGSGGRGLSGSATAFNTISNLANRRLVASMLVQEGGSSVGWASYTGGGPSLSCTDGAMTRKVSIDFNGGGSVSGSVHIFTYDNPTSGSAQTLSGSAAATGATMGIVLASKSYTGVDLTAGLGAVSNASSSAALSLPYTMSAGNVPVFAGAFQVPALGHNMSAIRHDGIPSGYSVPQWLLMADLFGASALTATDVNSASPYAYAAAGIVLKAA